MSKGDATRHELMRAARELFAERGYAAVGTNQVVQQAGVTRGAMYHHFADKRDLFRAVHERVEEEMISRIGGAMDEVANPWELMLAGTRSFLDACEEPAVKQIALIDAPAVLGWDEWREIDERYGLGLTRTALGGAIEAGVLRPLPLEPLSHLPLASLSEAALMIASAEDQASTRQEVETALVALLEGLRA
jgi:AcrR family transcriptional regulator